MRLPLVSLTLSLALATAATLAPLAASHVAAQTPTTATPAAQTPGMMTTPTPGMMTTPGTETTPTPGMMTTPTTATTPGATPAATPGVPSGQLPNVRQIPVVGTTDGGGTFNGTFDLQRFADQNGQLVGIGQLTGTLTDSRLPGGSGQVAQEAAIPVSFANAPAPTGSSALRLLSAEVAFQPSCDILNLILGPLDLNLLGLQVNLNQVVLDIVAVPGAGNLLGNLLCAVANLLNGPGTPVQLVGLLNQLLELLRA